MKKNNLWHLVWILGIFIILFIILYLVVTYKVKWEDRDLSTYLYFYNCSGNLCTTTEKVDKYYGTVKCEKKSCPYITKKNNDLVILNNNGKEFVYDYINDNVINEEYVYYDFVGDNLIAKNSDNLYGIISQTGEVLVEFKYQKILDYNNGFVAYQEDGKVGIENTPENINVKPTYEDVILINSKLYGYLEDNNYYIASYDTELPVNNTNYNYIFATDNVILVIKDKKIDILDSNLKSKLLMKIDTFYEYTSEIEKSSLNIYKEGSVLRFRVVTGEDNKATNYIYDLNSNKLYS